MFANKLQEKFKELKESVAQVHLADSSVTENRITICKSCDFFIPITSTCKKCGCFMAAKTKLKNVTCPINKW